MPLKQPYCLHTYVCNFPDQLTSYDGESITYDASGNPTNYLGATLVWEGQRLKSYTPKASSSGRSNSYVYSYDENGIRTRKTIGNTVTDYYYNGTLLMGTVKTTTNSDGSTTTSKLRFSYDADGKVVAVNYNGNYYYYLRNAQNDIVKLIDKTGATVVEYTYDSWGKLLSTSGSLASTLGKNNPFRYRGYVYDEETEFYYVQSRYYNPEIGRWINADIPETLTADFENFAQYNLFAYCFNDPVNMSDETGTWPSWATKLAIGIGAIIVGAAVVAATAATGGAAAAFVGAAVAGLKTAAVSGAIGAAVGAGKRAVSHRVSTGGWSGAGKAAVDGAVDGFANGFMTGGIMAGGSQILSSGFKVAANAGVPTGRNGGLTIGNRVRVLSPNHPQSYEAGGTLLKIGSKYKNIRFDVGSNSLFHMNIQLAKTANYHLPIGMLGAGLCGGIARD